MIYPARSTNAMNASWGPTSPHKSISHVRSSTSGPPGPHPRNVKILKGPGSMATKPKAWSRGLPARASFGHRLGIYPDAAF